jgi:hypothetical protein
LIDLDLSYYQSFNPSNMKTIRIFAAMGIAIACLLLFAFYLIPPATGQRFTLSPEALCDPARSGPDACYPLDADHALLITMGDGAASMISVTQLPEPSPNRPDLLSVAYALQAGGLTRRIDPHNVELRIQKGLDFVATDAKSPAPLLRLAQPEAGASSWLVVRDGNDWLITEMRKTPPQTDVQAVARAFALPEFLEETMEMAHDSRCDMLITLDLDLTRIQTGLGVAEIVDDGSDGASLSMFSNNDWIQKWLGSSTWVDAAAYEPYLPALAGDATASDSRGIAHPASWRGIAGLDAATSEPANFPEAEDASECRFALAGGHLILDGFAIRYQQEEVVFPLISFRRTACEICINRDEDCILIQTSGDCDMVLTCEGMPACNQ